MVRMLLLAIIMLVGILPLAAQAEEYQGVDEYAIGEEFSCTDGRPTSANGRLFKSGSCPDLDIQAFKDAPTTVEEDGTTSVGSKILLYFVCNFEDVLNQVFSRLYCAMQKEVLQPLKIVLILYITLFGVMITAGVVQFDAREVFTHLMKLALVWVFATNAEYTIGIAYTFFMKAAGASIAIVLSALDTDGRTSHTIAGTFDNLGNMMDKSLFGFVAEQGKNTVGLVMALAIVVFPLGLPILYNVAQLVAMIGRAVLGYLVAITGITFLMTLSPIFLAFALFQHTKMLFDKWLQYLISFSLQMMIVFGALVLWVMIDSDYKKVYNDLSDVYCPYQQVIVESPTRWAVDLPSVCEYTITEETIETPANAAGESHGSGNTLPKISKADPDDTNGLSPLVLMSRNDFIAQMGVKTLALILLAHIINAFMKMAPEIAKALGGLPYALRLGGPAPRSLTQPGPGIDFTGESAVNAAGQAAADTYFSTPGSVPEKVLSSMSKSWDTFTQGAMGPDGNIKTPGIFDSVMDDALSFGLDDNLNTMNAVNNRNQHEFWRASIKPPPGKPD